MTVNAHRGRSALTGSDTYWIDSALIVCSSLNYKANPIYLPSLSKETFPLSVEVVLLAGLVVVVSREDGGGDGVVIDVAAGFLPRF